MAFFKVALEELNLSLTLRSGQCFRWRKRATQDDEGLDVWLGILGRHVVSLTQNIDKGIIHYSFTTPERRTDNRNISNKKPKIDEESILREYFQLDVKLSPLYKSWSSVDPNFKKVASGVPGVRVLKQDPVENLISFICTSCNNIPRITSMIHKTCTTFGELLMTDEEFGDLHAFPTLESLASEEAAVGLSKLGLGYRAKYLTATAKMILNGGIRPLDELASPETSYEEARSELIKLPGVGRKVADCVCLFSLNKTQSVPVDTHVYQIACKQYMKYLDAKKKTLSEKDYEVIACFFRDLHGLNAGWAHSVLFTADLKLK